MSDRMKKVNELLTQEISKLLQEEFSEDFGIISVTYVNTAPDLKNANVGLSVFNIQKEDRFFKSINARAEHIRREIGGRIKLKNMPQFNFKSDHGTEKVVRVEQLLEQIEQEK